MKKVFFFAAMAIAAIGAQAQVSVGSAAIEFKYCFTTYGDKELNYGYASLPVTYEGVTFSKNEIDANNQIKKDVTLSVHNHRGCDSVQHVTMNVEMTYGQLGGKFTVYKSGGDVRQVYFSQGNLQYQAVGSDSQEHWRFAEHQYDMIGSGNSNISSTYIGWIDLVGWATSGWKYTGWMTGGTAEYYGQQGHSMSESGYTNMDWGINCKIDNGGSKGTWRTLTNDEWRYMIYNRSDKCGYATVNGVYGIVLLPDDWTLPSTLSAFIGINSSNSFGFSSNMYYTTDHASYEASKSWNAMEAAGAVFLPAAGYRDGTTYYSLYSGNECGQYWTATSQGSDNACQLFFKFNNVSHNTYNPGSAASKSRGCAVRLVRDVQ